MRIVHRLVPVVALAAFVPAAALAQSNIRAIKINLGITLLRRASNCIREIE